jgi:hypothetical protein
LSPKYYLINKGFCLYNFTGTQYMMGQAEFDEIEDELDSDDETIQLDSDETDQPSPENDVISPNGLICQPVVGVFNLSIGESRHAFASWIQDVMSAANTTGDWSGPENYAIIACGPENSVESHLIGADIYTSLYGRSGRTRIWFPHMQRGVVFHQGQTLQIVVHVSADEFDADDTFHERIVMADGSMPLEEQDVRLTGWLFRLFTDPEPIFREICEVYANATGWWDERPSTLYIDGVEVVQNDEDIEMSDNSEEDDDRPVVVEAHVRFYL